MRYEKDFLHLQLTEPTVLSLGKFDGLHRGHELLMKAVLEKTKTGLKAAVFTFDIPPNGTGAMQQVITTNEEKQQLFMECGTDYLIECPFTKEIMQMEAERFIQEVVTRLCVKWMVVGTDFRFGHQRRGDFHMLQEYAKAYGYQVQVVSKIRHNGRDISSTYIREALANGRIELANELLGYPYFIQGTVIHGNRVGRTIGFPTINILPLPQKLLPPLGVYLSAVRLDGKRYKGITNIGKKPTIEGYNPIGAETYIYDFTGDVYDKTAKIELLHFERPEVKFEGIEQLKRQLENDIAAGAAYFARHSQVAGE
ncbi:Bifunctional riboflavin kinase/FMN adenylyltransferase [Eubacterium plexicaudatum ASF492]|uniref:Riboflavin biosynthesis protein n=1 Tax=Eubacterium plexicaudatum ASF492 TaxID=1235802 RepID=N2B495_9FIRM|nr:Bifunctional riboflavin kinase/FMN adenylyltransferase [Eubacterium plexicaudatum ASF492]